MASCGDLPPSVMIVCLLLVRGSSPLPTTPGASPMSTRGVLSKTLSPKDYEDYDLPTMVPIKPIHPDEGKPQRCDYDPCLESQIPCANLSITTGCLCRGVTLHNVAPEAPDLKSVSWEGSEVVVRWCAPYSYVTAYIVTVGGEQSKKFGKGERSSGLGDVENVAEVCVSAVNDAGSSEESCTMYQPRDSSLPLKAGLIGGALGFLLLLLLAVLLWRHRRQRNQEASISMHNTAEMTQ
nr:leucine-rich repeat neuronal protein 4-like [Labrus bergylta]